MKLKPQTRKYVSSLWAIEVFDWTNYSKQYKILIEKSLFYVKILKLNGYEKKSWLTDFEILSALLINYLYE